MITHIERFWHTYILSALVIASLFIWYVVWTERPHPLRFVMLDVGQGEALYVKAPNGNQVIIDGGPGDALLGQLSKVMPPFDRSIDMIINTSPDTNCFEGFIPLLDRYSVGAFMESGSDASTNSLWTELKKKVALQKIPDIVAERGQHIDLGDGVYIDILFPDSTSSVATDDGGSIVAKLVYGKTSVMLMGNATQSVEMHLLASEGSAYLRSTIVQVGHNGSKTSSSDVFIKAVHPEMALISAGKNNPYGLPDQVTLDTLNKNKVQYLITFDEGLIEYDSDGTTFTRVK